MTIFGLDLSNKNNNIILFGLLLALLMVAGCGSSNDSNFDNSYPANTLTALSSNEQLETYLKDQFAKSVITYETNDNFFDGPVLPLPGIGIGDGSAGAGIESGSSYTNTNVQEEGVDEADRAKTDGTYLYIAKQHRVAVVKTSEPFQEVGGIDINGIVDALYLYKNVLVVLYIPLNGEGDRLRSSSQPIGVPCWIPYDAKVGISLYDVSNPAEPGLIKTVEMDGYLVDSRRINGKLHLILQFLPNLSSLTLYCDKDSYGEVVAANRSALENLTLEQLIPFYQTNSLQNGVGIRKQAIAPENFYRAIDDDGGGSVTTVITINLDAPEMEFDSIGIIANAHSVYASMQSLYVISNRLPYLSMPTSIPEQYMAVHKFDLTGEKVQSVGSGAVKGWILNQFSLGEYEDVLRIATSTGNMWGPTPSSENGVYCLTFQDNKMEVIGKLENLAPGEQIYAVRFIGKRGFLVTFVKVDPLFTLDLSDPAAPKVAGELKVPGFSEYIHPYGENHLITIGKDAVNDSGFAWYQGVQLSIFDITDFSNPTLVGEPLLIGDRGTNSEALYNHKAFTFWNQNNLLAIPIDLYEHASEPTSPSVFGQYQHSGLYVYRVSVDRGFELQGTIQTRTTGFPLWTRGVFIDEYVYALTPGSVYKALIEDMAQTLETLPLVD